jgi:uncharacterized sulfatase
MAMNFIGNNQVRLIKRMFFLLIIYSLVRIGFYQYHINIYHHFSWDEILKSLILGIRFDIAGIILVNIPVVFFSFINLYSKGLFEKIERILFVVLNTVALLMSLDDYELFLFMGKRLSYDLFFITEDIFQQLPQLLLNYWFMPLISILFGISFYYGDKRFFHLKKDDRKSFLGMFIFLGCLFVGIRGGVQSKSINVQSAFVQGKNELGHLVLNSPYHFLRTLKNGPRKKITYFETDEEAKSQILKERQLISDYKGQKSANLVLIILESFSMEYVEKGYTPFLSELKSKGLFFERHLANGRRSIEALPSLLCGLPSLIEEPISKSVYAGNKFQCFSQILKAKGYRNYFFHGGNRGTMGFESYTLSNGFHKYFARDDYGEEDYDGTWGVYDLPYLEYVVKSISKIEGPFVSGIFTLSSHQPYSIPQNFKGKFPKGTLDIHESIGYVDFSLRNFFQKAQKEKWFKDTYFVITSDHTQKLESPKFSNLVGRYRVPLILLGPGIKAGVVSKVTQHSDIPSTVLDLLEVDGELPLTGVSVLSRDNGLALNFADGNTYFIATGNKVLTLNSEKIYDWDKGAFINETTSSSLLLKAYLQYFNNGLIKNNL